jgi:hypothetical protein
VIRASSIHRYRNCSGAPAAESGIPQSKEKSWTGDGRLIHDALKDESKMPLLTDELFDVAARLADTAAYIVDKIFPPDAEGIERGEVVREREEPFYVIHNGERIISGHPDFIQYGMIYGKRVALILDFKSGFLDVPSPEVNDQIRSYSVAVWQESVALAERMDNPELAIDEVYASIIPRYGLPTPVLYDAKSLPQALLDLAEIDEAVRDAKAVRTPSVDACRFCLARATSRCPETLYPPEKLKSMPSLIDLSPAEKGQLLSLTKIVAGNIKALTERLYEELEIDPNAVEGWELAKGKTAKNIEDVSACYQQVSEILEAEQYQKCLKVHKTRLLQSLKAYLKERENIKGKTAENRINALLDPVIVAKEGKKQLVPKGAAIEEEEES